MRLNPALILRILPVPISAHAKDDALLDLARQHPCAMTQDVRSVSAEGPESK